MSLGLLLSIQGITNIMTAMELNGTVERFAVDNLATEEECEKLIHLAGVRVAHLIDCTGSVGILSRIRHAGLFFIIIISKLNMIQ